MAKFVDVLSSLAGLVGRALRRVLPRDERRRLDPEEFLLEQAEVIEPIAPGVTGRVRVRRGDLSAEIDARGEPGDQAFARGMQVRLIDYRDGSYLVEPWDEEHLVR